MEAFNKILKTGRKPKYLRVDKGLEFYNKYLKNLLSEKGMNLYSTENEEKSSAVERWNKTMKGRLWKFFTASNSTYYIDVLAALLDKYNKTKHRSIKMTPEQASRKENEDRVYLNLYGQEMLQTAKPKFKVGDKVRISKYKRKVFDKGYTPNWSEEIFVVDKIQFTSPITYKIKDLNGEEILGSFYYQELSRASQEIFRIERILKQDKKTRESFCKMFRFLSEI